MENCAERAKKRYLARVKAEETPFDPVKNLAEMFGNTAAGNVEAKRERGIDPLANGMPEPEPAEEEPHWLRELRMEGGEAEADDEIGSLFADVGEEPLTVEADWKEAETSPTSVTSNYLEVEDIKDVEEVKRAPLRIEPPKPKGRPHYVFAQIDSRPRLDGKGACWRVKNGSGSVRHRLKSLTLPRVVVVYEKPGGYRCEDGLHKRFTDFRIPTAGDGKGAEWYEMWEGNPIWDWLLEANPKGLVKLLLEQAKALRKNGGPEPKAKTGRRPDWPEPEELAALMGLLEGQSVISLKAVQRTFDCGSGKAKRWRAYAARLLAARKERE